MGHCGSVHCAWKHPVVVVVVRENSIMETSFLICDMINVIEIREGKLIFYEYRMILAIKKPL